MRFKSVLLFLFTLLVLKSSLLANSEVTLSDEAYDDESEQVNQIYGAYLSLFEDKNLSEFRKTRLKKDYLDKEMLDLNNLIISSTEEKQILKNIAFIKMHHEIPKTLKFPKGIRITHVRPIPSNVIKTSFDIKGHNTIDLIASIDLKKATLLIKYLDGNIKKNMSLFVENTKNVKKKEKDTIYLITEFNKRKTLTPLQALNAFKKAKKRLPNDKESIYVKGYGTYAFIEDNLNGKIRIDGKKFKILTKFDGVEE